MSSTVAGEVVALSEAQVRTLAILADGAWHRGGRTTSDDGRVLGVPALALVRMGLAERRGESRGPKPTASGYEYRLTDAGRALCGQQGPVGTICKGSEGALGSAASVPDWWPR